MLLNISKKKTFIDILTQLQIYNLSYKDIVINKNILADMLLEYILKRIIFKVVTMDNNI